MSGSCGPRNGTAAAGVELLRRATDPGSLALPRPTDHPHVPRAGALPARLPNCLASERVAAASVGFLRGVDRG
jgi:hypothetical protein